MTFTLPSRVAPHLRRAGAIAPRLGSRSLTQTRPARAEEKSKSKKEDDEDGDEDDEDGKRTPRRTFTGPNQKWEDPPFIAWLRSTGEQFRKVTPEGRQYLGGRDTPFPLNPSFKPPVPMSDKARSRMYLEYMKGGKTIRELARGNGSISLRRAEAVIRLKHVELEMRMEGRRPETSFNAVMEQALGVAAAEASREAEEKELALEAELEARERKAHNAGLTPEDEDWQHDEEEWLDWLENKHRPGGIGGVGGKRTFDSGRRNTIAGSSAARMAQLMQSGDKSAPLDDDLHKVETPSEPDVPAVPYPTTGSTAAEFSRFMDDMVSAPEAPYIRMYFEPVAEEGTARPILGDLVKKHRAKFEARQAKRASPQLSVTHVPRRGGKTMFEFVDVGGAYRKERDVHVRDKAAERRQTVRVKKLAERSDGLRLAKAAASTSPPTA